MTDLQYYVHPIPDNDQSRNNQRQRPETSLAGQLGQDSNVADAVSTPPGEQRIQAQHKGRHADLMAAELDELTASSGFVQLPLFAPDGESAVDGFYVVESSDIGPADPRERRIQDIDVSLRRDGTRGNRYRAVQTTRRQVTHPFGNAVRRRIGLPATADEVHWVDPETDTATVANRVTVRTAELGDIAIYDVEEAPLQEPVLIYDVPFGDIGPVDVRVFDTRGFSSREDADGSVQFQKVFVSTHDFDGSPLVINSGLLRLTLDPDSSPGILAEQFDPAGGGFVTVALGSSPWELTSVDLGHRRDQTVAPTRVGARLRFSDGSQRYTLDASVTRGQDVVQFDRSQTSGSPVPSGLQTLLDPIASASVLSATPSQGVRPRSEVDI